MNYAIIFAGGVGSRMRTGGIPKQFIEVAGKPILIHTIWNFEKHDSIDGICVICVKGWAEKLRDPKGRLDCRRSADRPAIHLQRIEGGL